MVEGIRQNMYMKDIFLGIRMQLHIGCSVIFGAIPIQALKALLINNL